jgi:hypothetical protein
LPIDHEAKTEPMPKTAVAKKGWLVAKDNPEQKYGTYFGYYPLGVALPIFLRAFRVATHLHFM